MIVCIDVAWIHHRQTQWYEIWHFAICLSPINVFSSRFLVPHLHFFPTPTRLSSLRPGNTAGPERLSLKPYHLRDVAAGAGTAHAQLPPGPADHSCCSAHRQRKGTRSAEDPWCPLQQHLAHCFYCAYHLGICRLDICILDNGRKKRKWWFKLSKRLRASVNHFYTDFQATRLLTCR